MAPTPSPSPRPILHQTPSRTTTSATPHSKHRLNFNKLTSPLPSLKEPTPTEHPVEVIARIRNLPDSKNPPPTPFLQPSDDNLSIRVNSDIAYRNFSLDGVSLSETEDLEGFYKKFVGSRVEGVRVGDKCTIMMYGPTGSGKSHTMFGCAKQPGIVYRALRDILGGGGDDDDDDVVDGIGLFVQVSVVEIYNEEIYDLLSVGLMNAGIGIPKGNQTPKVRLEVMGRKAKNATFITGNEAGKISREVAKVEKRRIVKSTNCNERSSRSHCLIILDVPSVGGRLMLVDMAGSENIEQAGQSGFEAKMQTAKINQGNIALKRVVESIANGDSHVPFRDSKLTMLLQDSFEDDKSKILMILCASPDPKEMHKTISTLEYGAKAKCIVRAAHMPTPRTDKMGPNDESSTQLNSRIVAMNQFIYKLQMDNKIKEKECDEVHRELEKKEEELLSLRAKIKVIEGKGSTLKEEEINTRVNERTQMLKTEIMKMEEKMTRQQEELGLLRKRLEEMESKRSNFSEEMESVTDGGRFAKKLSEIYGGDQGMEKSMELDMGDQPIIHDVKEINESPQQNNSYWNSSEEVDVMNIMKLADRVCLSTVFERADEGEEIESTEDNEVDKEVVEEHSGVGSRLDSDSYITTPNFSCEDTSKLSSYDRKTRIQNIFRLCGNYRELAQQVKPKTPTKTPEDRKTHLSPISEKRKPESLVSASPLRAPLALLQLTEEGKPTYIVASPQELKENCRPGQEVDGMIEVCVKWEGSKEFDGITTKKFRVLKDSTLSDLRKLIEIHLDEDDNKQSFSFVQLRDPSGVPAAIEKESTVPVCKLPLCNNQLNTRLACLRQIKKTPQRPIHTPLGSLENTMPFTGFV